MNRIVVFILGFISGAAALFFVLLVFVLLSDKHKENIRNQKIANTQYVDVRGAKGDVTLHTYMPKDSVKMLLGQPTNIDLTTVGSDSHEIWWYEFMEQGCITPSTLTVAFINGELESIRKF